MSGTTTAFKKVFTKINAKDLAGAAVMDEPLDDRSALAMELLAAPKNLRLRAYRVVKPVAPAAGIVVYPSLLANTPTLELSRNELEDEVRLLLERKQQVPFQDDTYVYSIRALAPAPFRPSPQLLGALGLLPEGLANNVRVGYLTHDVLYGLLGDEGRLVALLDAFLRDVTEVEVKVRRAPEDQRAVTVTLAE